jgi:hypothetical protein
MPIITLVVAFILLSIYTRETKTKRESEREKDFILHYSYLNLFFMLLSSNEKKIKMKNYITKYK